jgi:hypothetical protein
MTKTELATIVAAMLAKEETTMSEAASEALDLIETVDRVIESRRKSKLKKEVS